MEKDIRIYTQEYCIGWQDVDPEGRLKLKTMSAWMQETAWKHAGQLGYGSDFMSLHESIWVMFRLSISMYQYPEWDESVQLITWPRGLKGVFALRDFELRNKDNELLAAAATEWLVIGREDRKPRKSDMLTPFVPFTLPEKRTAVDSLFMPGECEEAFLGKHKVDYTELDMNRHVNTSSYLEWTLNHIPVSLLSQKTVRNLSITFLSECTQEDEIYFYGSLYQEPCFVKGCRSSDGKPVFQSVFLMQ
jgi:acyl-ACP thioesterase